MFTPLRAALAGVAAIAALAFYDLADIRLWIGDRIDPTRMQTQDWVFWIVGPQLIGAALWSFLQRDTVFRWRSTALLVVGALMVYTEAADVLPLKERACQLIHASAPAPGEGTCYPVPPLAPPAKA